MTRRQFRVADYPWLMRLIFRSTYVLFTTCVAAALPFFSGACAGEWFRVRFCRFLGALTVGVLGEGSLRG